MVWLMRQLNRNIAILNTTSQLLDIIYNIDIDIDNGKKKKKLKQVQRHEMIVFFKTIYFFPHSIEFANGLKVLTRPFSGYNAQCPLLEDFGKSLQTQA